MSLALVVASRSPDISTKHGALICNARHQILGVGYNGFPRGSRDSLKPQDRPAKYDHIIHAEANCLLNSQNLLSGCGYTVYVTGFPCPGCFNLMVQAGVEQIVYGPITSACIDSGKVQLVKEEAQDRGVVLRYFGGPLLLEKLPEKYLFVKETKLNPFGYESIVMGQHLA